MTPFKLDSWLFIIISSQKSLREVKKAESNQSSLMSLTHICKICGQRQSISRNSVADFLHAI